jgi:hypothetical protein
MDIFFFFCQIAIFFNKKKDKIEEFKMVGTVSLGSQEKYKEGTIKCSINERYIITVYSSYHTKVTLNYRNENLNDGPLRHQNYGRIIIIIIIIIRVVKIVL